MRKYSMLFFTFLVNVLVSQEISLDLPVLSPKTPNAFEFTKYGEIQVNESTGVISPSIPVFTYNAGPMFIPIVLQYSGNGVKVNQEPSWAGMNWNVNPTGVITRQVRDLVDEKTISSYKKFMSSTDIHQLQGEGNPDGSNSEWATYLRSIADNDYIDSEVDIFNYNFLGYSGSFFLDENLNAYLINYNKEVRITFDTIPNNQSQITITTPNGDVYFFGYVNSDASKSFTNSSSSGPGLFGLASEAQNAFYLYRVSPIHGGGTIDFEYNNMVSGTYTYETGEQESYTVTSTLFDGCGTGSPVYPTGGNINKSTLYTSYSSAVYLTKITSSFTSQVVEFNSEKIGALAIASHHRRKLNSIVLKNDNGVIINKCNLNYEIVESEEKDYENRFFLKNVDLFGRSNINPQQYILSYNNIHGLPKKDSYDQDHFGYFNNAENLYTLLPRLENVPVIEDNENLANREADSIASMYGTLTKIEYPTGGFTEFEYNLRKTGEEFKQIPYQMYVYYNQAPYPDLITDIVPDPAIEDLGFVNSQYTDIKVNVTATVEGDLTQHNFIEVIAEKLFFPNNQIIKQIQIQNPENTTINYSQDILFENLAPGSYIFKLKLNLSSADDTKINAHADLTLPSTELISVFGSGIRIKRIKSQVNESVVPIIKRFYYNNKENYLEETNTKIIMEPVYTYESRSRSICGYTYTEKLHNNLSASSLNNVFGSDAGKILYPFVTISFGGDNFESGGKELEFSIIKESFPLIEYGQQIYSNYGSNRPHANSNLKKETIFTKNGALITKLKETINKYQTDYSKSFTMYNIKTSSYFNKDAFLSDRLEPFNIGLYETTSYWGYLESTEIKDYRKDINNPIITKTIYEYTNGLAGLPSKVETNNSLGTSNSQKLFYPKDVSTISGLDSINISKINDLVTKHQLDELIRIESYKNDNLLNTIQKAYNTWNSNILTERIQFSKNGMGLDDRVVFHDYNSFAKPILLSKKDGSKTKYFYNSLQQVTIKIDNYIDVPGEETTEPCTYQDFYASSLVTSYEYDTNTKALIRVTQPNCDINYFVYDDFNRLQFIKDKDGNVLEQYRYNYALEELVANATSNTSSSAVGDAVTFTANITGGSGNFNYEWTIPGESILPNASQILINTTLSHTPSFTATCKITDNQTQESITVYKTVTVSQSYPALSVDPIITIPAASPRKSVGQSVTYSITVTNGSGNYQYEWSKTNSQSTISIGANTNTITDIVTTSDCGNFTITCKVTDINSAESITKTMDLVVICDISR